jgi:hypothetical protein
VNRNTVHLKLPNSLLNKERKRSAARKFQKENS